MGDSSTRVSLPRQIHDLLENCDQFFDSSTGLNDESSSRWDILEKVASRTRAWDLCDREVLAVAAYMRALSRSTTTARQLDCILEAIQSDSTSESLTTDSQEWAQTILDGSKSTAQTVASSTWGVAVDSGLLLTALDITAFSLGSFVGASDIPGFSSALNWIGSKIDGQPDEVVLNLLVEDMMLLWALLNANQNETCGEYFERLVVEIDAMAKRRNVNARVDRRSAKFQYFATCLGLLYADERVRSTVAEVTPTLTGMSLADAKTLAAAYGLDVKPTDEWPSESGERSRLKAGNWVVDYQIPMPGTSRSDVPIQVWVRRSDEHPQPWNQFFASPPAEAAKPIPDLVGLSLARALDEAANNGFDLLCLDASQLGAPDFQPDPETGWYVRRQLPGARNGLLTVLLLPKGRSSLNV